jgi:hypothetical protein
MKGLQCKKTGFADNERKIKRQLNVINRTSSLPLFVPSHVGQEASRHTGPAQTNGPTHLSLASYSIFLPEKVHITFLNFRKSSFFLPELQNRTKHLPRLLKPFILPP